jgi:hypothetical protein
MIARSRSLAIARRRAIPAARWSKRKTHVNIVERGLDFSSSIRDPYRRDSILPPRCALTDPRLVDFVG